MNEIRIFNYNGSNITFNRDDCVMVNATQMAKPFGKRPAKWLELPSTKEFLSKLTEVRKSDIGFVRTEKGGNLGGGGTWMHEDVALEFARWLSPEFAIWCNDRIKDLFRQGVAVTDSTEHLLAELRDSRTQDADKLLRRQVTAFNKRLKEYTSDGRYFLGAGYGPASREQSGIVLAPGLTFEQSLKSLFGQLDEAFLMFFSRNYGIAKGETAMQLRMEAMRNQIALLGKMAGVL